MLLRQALATVVVAAFCLGSQAMAANYPCSGKKGGIAHCAGAQFVCNDGSISGSKRVCSMSGDEGGPAQRSSPKQSFVSGDDGCSCRSGRLCTGPRGGRYCISDSGRKSYVRN